MKLRQRGLVASILMATLVVSPLVDAKRAGNGKSQGMQRSIAPSQSSQQQQRVRPQPSPSYNNTAPQPQQKQGSGIGKMVAAGAAGAAVGALATHALADNNHAAPANNGNASNTGTANANDATATQSNNQQQHAEQPAEKKSGGLPWLWIILIAGAGFFIFRKMSAKKKLESNNNPYSPNNNGGSSFGSNSTAANTSNDNNTNIFGQNVGGGTNMNTEAPFTSNGNQLPDGTEQAAFLRVARQRFNHIQSINSAKNIEEIRRYLTNDLYNSMYQDVMANQEQDVAEFENLTATLADTATENGQYIASVRFTGMVSEDLNSSPKPFSEIWHFVKPVNSQQDWLVAGIQVEN
ncbi:Tim44 domain-containing protein [Acinetobacter nectaris]|uniref:Tim44 domain-containing protein n=1 Tax=Acinetobacter nectaris TaxID=1219382 RepID=UPI001F16BD42|nr:TIM44-like domain-containing protein [Acinetobacter nectaris]MCF8998952.1 Tim44 domain-containing protein [Acinetobacter nectaris]MCF9027455.1 Tim44 domain-containing protein [Acinetobacter nectaris]